MVDVLHFEFLINRRPVSLQTRNRSNLQAWKDSVKSEAAKGWSSAPLAVDDLHLTLVYLCADDPPDVDNIIKPILDALIGLIYVDDSLVTDVESHRRYLAKGIDVTDLPPLLQKAVFVGEECVYIKIENSKPLENYL